MGAIFEARAVHEALPRPVCFWPAVRGGGGNAQRGIPAGGQDCGREDLPRRPQSRLLQDADGERRLGFGARDQRRPLDHPSDTGCQWWREAFSFLEWLLHGVGKLSCCRICARTFRHLDFTIARVFQQGEIRQTLISRVLNDTAWRRNARSIDYRKYRQRSDCGHCRRFASWSPWIEVQPDHSGAVSVCIVL